MNQFIDLSTSLYLLRIPNCQRYAERFFVHKSFVEPAMLTQIETQIGSINNNRILGQAIFIQIIEYLPYTIVNRLNAFQIVAQVTLVFPFGQIFSFRLVFQEGFVS